MICLFTVHHRQWRMGYNHRINIRANTQSIDRTIEVTKKAAEEQVFDFEGALENLEELVSAMEDGELTLEESLKAFEKGIKLTRECQAALTKAEQKVQMLISENGEPDVVDFEAEDNG